MGPPTLSTQQKLQNRGWLTTILVGPHLAPLDDGRLGTQSLVTNQNRHHKIRCKKMSMIRGPTTPTANSKREGPLPFSSRSQYHMGMLWCSQGRMSSTLPPG